MHCGTAVLTYHSHVRFLPITLPRIMVSAVRKLSLLWKSRIRSWVATGLGTLVQSNWCDMSCPISRQVFIQKHCHILTEKQWCPILLEEWGPHSTISRYIMPVMLASVKKKGLYTLAFKDYKKHLLLVSCMTSTLAWVLARCLMYVHSGFSSTQVE